MKPRYTKPQARDLGGYRSMLASGQWDGPPMPPMPGGPPGTGPDGGSGDELTGMCWAGARPYYNCANGTEFTGACNVGDVPDTSACSYGYYHTYPACKAGGVAATLCLSGQGQNF